MSEENRLKSKEVMKKMGLVKSVGRVILMWVDYLGLIDDKPVVDVFKMAMNNTIRRTVQRGTVQPDSVARTFVQSMKDFDLTGRFRMAIDMYGTQFHTSTFSFDVALLHKRWEEDLDHPFYYLTLFMYQDPYSEVDNGFTAVGFCGDQVFFDQNTSIKTLCFNIANGYKNLNFDPLKAKATSIFVLKMEQCHCGCHEVILQRVNKVSK